MVWVTSIVPLALSVQCAWIIIKTLISEPHEIGNSWLMALLFCFPWVALYKMNVAWLSGNKVSKFWPISGTIFGIGGVIASFGVGAFLAPTAIIFAYYLITFNLR